MVRRKRGKKSTTRAERLAKRGRFLINLCLLLLMLGGLLVGIGGRIVSALDPEAIPAGENPLRNPWFLVIVIPIWSIGIVGIVLSFSAWVASPFMMRELDLGFDLRPDGKIFSRPVKLLCGFAAALVGLSITFGFGSSGVEFFAFLYFFCMCGFLLYLSWFYRADSHHATTTYLNLLTPLLAVLISPLSWPLLLTFHVQLIRSTRERRRSKGRRPR